ncbi:MAG: acetyl-CoA carboxylase carboxyl transferase subunit alpha [Saprospiraceae bacterium]|jgi:acetyl-CoA carboxylase carboxyl transferase subunit alpha
MTYDHLEFEKPIAELEEKIEELERVSSKGEDGVDFSAEILKLKNKCKEKTKDIFSRLDATQITQIARHPDRPYTLDYIGELLTDFQELHGDRHYADDPAIVAGIGRFEGRGVAVIGHQKGRDAKERTYRNWGMPRPEGYRKAQRIMDMAERFNLPLITLIDTPGAYPGVGAEERGQAEAIAFSLEKLSELKVPIIATVIGEGGSGGALAIGVCDYLIMLEFSTYSVISPEGCAAILWKSADKAREAAEAMGVTTKHLSEHGLIDEIIKEPLGGVHRDMKPVVEQLRASIAKQLDTFCAQSVDELLDSRYKRLTAYGNFTVDGVK